MSLAVLLLAATAGADSAPLHRYALVVGDDSGDADEVTLRYAQRDAERLASILRDVGGVAPEDLLILTNVEDTEMRKALIGLNARTLLLGVSPDFALLYETPAAAAGVTSGSTGILDSASLSQPGYHLLDGCSLGTGSADQVVADSSPIDIDPGATFGERDPTLQTCASGQLDCSAMACPLYCNSVQGPGTPSGCGCMPESKNVSYEMGSTCNSDADCCTGLCSQWDGGPGVCGAVTPDFGWCSPNGCDTAVLNQGAVVPLEQVAVPLPTVSQGGGYPPAGTYVLTAATVFTEFDGPTGPTGDTYQGTIVIGPSVGDAGVAFTQVSNDNGCANTTTAVLSLGPDASGTLTFTGCESVGDAPFPLYALNPGTPTTFLVGDAFAPYFLTYTQLP